MAQPDWLVGEKLKCVNKRVRWCDGTKGWYLRACCEDLKCISQKKKNGKFKKIAIEYEFGHRHGGCVIDNKDHGLDYIILLPTQETKPTLTNSIYYLHCDGLYYSLERAQLQGYRSSWDWTTSCMGERFERMPSEVIREELRPHQRSIEAILKKRVQDVMWHGEEEWVEEFEETDEGETESSDEDEQIENDDDENEEEDDETGGEDSDGDISMGST